jgi:hypothetical protein
MIETGMLCELYYYFGKCAARNLQYISYYLGTDKKFLGSEGKFFSSWNKYEGLGCNISCGYREDLI